MSPPPAATRIGWLALAALALYFLAVFGFQMNLMADTDYPSAGARLLFKYHLVGEPDAFGDSYLAAYIDAFDHPYLYDAVTRLWLQAGGDLVVLHRLLPMACWLLFLIGMALAARQLGDRLTVLGAVGLAVAQPLYLFQITSAMPHALGFPLVIWAVVALLHGSARGLLLLTLLSGVTYPAMTPLLGLLLAWQLIVAQPIWRAPRRAQAARLLLLAASGLLSLWLVFDAITPPDEFGPALAPGEKAELYPENGPEGRPSASLFNPVSHVAARVFLQFRDLFEHSRIFLLVIYACVAGYGILALPRGGAGRRAFLALLICAAAVCLVILALRPHLFYRFLFYPLYSVMPLLFVLGLQRFCRSLGPLRRFADLPAVLLLAVFVLGIDSFSARRIGYPWHLDGEYRQVLDFAARQPPGTLFAAWPGDRNHFEWLPYMAKRPLFVMFYLHEPRYENHILEMRRRMSALVEGYFATEPSALESLQCDWGVDYVIAEKAHFRPEAEAPWYFAPFSARIREIWETVPRGDLLLGRPEPARVALETTRFFVVRLDGPCARS